MIASLPCYAKDRFFGGVSCGDISWDVWGVSSD